MNKADPSRFNKFEVEDGKASEVMVSSKEEIHNRFSTKNQSNSADHCRESRENRYILKFESFRTTELTRTATIVDCAPFRSGGK